MKNIIAIVMAFGAFDCSPVPKPIHCDDRFFDCASDCASICEKTISHTYEFGKCFTQCNSPCRKDYCKKARMVKQVDTEDLKFFACNGHGGSSPSVSIVK